MNVKDYNKGGVYNGDGYIDESMYVCVHPSIDESINLDSSMEVHPSIDKSFDYDCSMEVNNGSIYDVTNTRHKSVYMYENNGCTYYYYYDDAPNELIPIDVINNYTYMYTYHCTYYNGCYYYSYDHPMNEQIIVDNDNLENNDHNTFNNEQLINNLENNDHFIINNIESTINNDGHDNDISMVYNDQLYDHIINKENNTFKNDNDSSMEYNDNDSSMEYNDKRMDYSMEYNEQCSKEYYDKILLENVLNTVAQKPNDLVVTIPMTIPILIM